MIGEAVLRFFEHNFDAPLVVQLLCIAFSAVLLLGVPAGTKIKPLRFAVETVCLAAVFLLLNIVFSVAAVLARLTFGSYWNYLLGIALYAAVRSRHSAAARMAMGCAVFAAAVLMASFGTICGNMIEFRVEGFDIAVTKIVSSLLTLVCACVFYKYPLFRFELSGFDAALNAACNLLSAMLCIVYELMRLYNRDLHEASNALAGYISLVEGAMFIINIVTYFMTYYICREKERVLAYQAERQKTRSLEQLLTLSEARLAELREVRHDVKNQYAYMQSLLEQNKYDDLRAYFNELVGTFSKPLCDVVESGKALHKLAEMVTAQHGDASYIMHPEKFPLGKKVEVVSDADGFVDKIRADDIGRAVTCLGGGRMKKEDKIDFSVGAVMNVELGSKVKRGDVLCTVYHNGKGLDEAVNLLKNAIHVGDKSPAPHKIAFAYVDKNGVELY